MDTNNNLPWRRGPPGTRSTYQPQSSIPRKRPADAQEAAWVAGEDKFVLQQAKKKAEIRVKEGRARPIDWLAVTLRFIDTSRNPFDDEVADSDLNVVDPEGVFEGLDDAKLAELEKDIDVYVSLESNTISREFWETMKVICNDRRQKTKTQGPEGRATNTVSSDVDKLFSTKNLDELLAIEKQIKTKLRSNEPIDFEYWDQMLKSLISWKARARLRRVSQSVVENQLRGLRQQQAEEANLVKTKLRSMLGGMGQDTEGKLGRSDFSLDPQAMLKISTNDKNLELQDESDFLMQIAMERRKVLKLGFVPPKRKGDDKQTIVNSESIKRQSTRNDESLQSATSLYEREAAKGVAEDEEVFAAEAEVTTSSKSQWDGKYRPRKPRYFNRVQMGYEWNKYNQTHYDHDNPPPKVVQGYKFNVFYPDLIDKTKAPTYKIEREHGRRRGQSFAAAGEEDTCLIRFVAGPPYEDVAFRIVDKEWDYSAKRDRGFKSSFDKGILQLHFQFKKIFYRK